MSSLKEKTNNLPTKLEILSWSNEKLNAVIASGEKLNWNIGVGETQHEIDDYVMDLYSVHVARNPESLGDI